MTVFHLSERALWLMLAVGAVSLVLLRALTIILQPPKDHPCE